MAERLCKWCGRPLPYGASAAMRYHPACKAAKEAAPKREQLHCQICGEPLPEGVNKFRKYCDVCRADIMRSTGEEAERKEIRRKAARHVSGLEDKVREADRLGLTYGQLQLRRYLQNSGK